MLETVTDKDTSSVKHFFFLRGGGGRGGMFGNVTAKIIDFYLQALFFLGGGIK